MHEQPQEALAPVCRLHVLGNGTTVNRGQQSAAPPSADGQASSAWHTPAPAVTSIGSTITSVPETARSPAPLQQQQQQQQQQPSPAEVMELLLQQIVVSNNEAALATTLLNSLGTPDARESILASVTPAGEDPLDALDAARHTIGVLFILCVVVFSFLSHFFLSFTPSFPAPHGVASLLLRWNVGCSQRNGVADVFIACFLLSFTYRSFGSYFFLLVFLGPPRHFLPSGRSARLTSTIATAAPAVPFAYIQNFCQNLNPEAARRAPERGKYLALRVVPQTFHTDVLASQSDVHFAPSDNARKGNCAARRGSGPRTFFFSLCPFGLHRLHDCTGACFVPR